MATFNFTGVLQTFLVPANVCSVTIRAEGASGGNYSAAIFVPGGLGASIQGDFLVTPGETLSVLVGEAGATNNTSGAGGGGGSFVWRGNGFAALNSSTLLVAAGGGGGASSSPITGIGGAGQITENGGSGSAGSDADGGGGGAGGTATMGGAGGPGGGIGGAGGPGGSGFGAGGGGGGGSDLDGGGGGGSGISGNGGIGGISAGTATGGQGGLAIISGGTGGAGGSGTGGPGTPGGFGGGGGAGGDGDVNDDGGGGGGAGFAGGGGGGAGGTSGVSLGGGGGGGGSFNSGENQINLSGVNPGNGVVEITLIPNQPPTIQCPPDITVNNDPGQCSAEVTYTGTATDDCSGIASVTCTHNGTSTTQTFPGNPLEVTYTMTETFPVGTTMVTCTATDAAGSISAPCSFTVTVNDTEPPVITCPADITVSNDPGQCGAIVTYPAPMVSDNCPGATAACSPASGTFFPVGMTAVTCTATDAVGNTSSCSFTVTSFRKNALHSLKTAVGKMAL
ncbi:HYR domain-containing protein [Peribacillus frigoritolerans]|uniref:HYR domain-containing protein n=1 Tax=Peribacillus frigoritolerans TaxID=450367 RepID=UPI003392D4B3